MDDADRALLLFGRELAVVQPHLRRFQGVYVHPHNCVLLGLMVQHEVRTFGLLEDPLGDLPALGGVLLVEQVLYGVETHLAPHFLTCVIHLVIIN